MKNQIKNLESKAVKNVTAVKGGNGDVMLMPIEQPIRPK
jgi:hypothetical protein